MRTASSIGRMMTGRACDCENHDRQGRFQRNQGTPMTPITSTDKTGLCAAEKARSASDLLDFLRL
jgi:hypothetical protein